MPWLGFYVPKANQPMDLNEDGTPDVYFYTGTAPTSQIAGVTYINVSGGTQQRSLLSCRPRQSAMADKRPARLEQQDVPLSHFDDGLDGQPET